MGTLGQVRPRGRLGSELSLLLLRGAWAPFGAGTTFAPLRRVGVRAGSRAQTPPSVRSRHHHGGWRGHPRRARRWTQTQNLTLSIYVCLQTPLKRQGCSLATHGGITPPVCLYVGCQPCRVPSLPHGCQPSATPVAARRLAPKPSELRDPSSPRKRQRFRCVHGFPFASDVLERWPCPEINSGAQILSRVCLGKPRSYGKSAAENPLPTALGIFLRHGQERV